MPIRPENIARYPVNWGEISAAIKKRANHKCENCGVSNYALGGRASDGRFLPATPKGERLARLQWPVPGESWYCQDNEGSQYLRIIKIVLTVAHLDHTPENCDPENLRAWCQRCHNRYDAGMRRAGIKARAKVNNALGDLFE